MSLPQSWPGGRQRRKRNDCNTQEFGKIGESVLKIRTRVITDPRGRKKGTTSLVVQQSLVRSGIKGHHVTHDSGFTWLTWTLSPSSARSSGPEHHLS